MEIYIGNSEKRSFKYEFKQFVKGLLTTHYVGYRMFLKDLRSEYVKTKMGFFWDFLEPLIFSLVFIIIEKIRVMEVQYSGIPYALFVSFGLLTWQTFVESLLMPIRISSVSKSIFSHLKIKPEAFFYSSLFRVFFNSFFRIVVIVIFLFYFESFSITGFLKYIALFPVVTIAGFSIGFFFSPLNVVYKDIERIINISLRPLLYISNVVFPLASGGLMGYLKIYNPLSVIITNLRSVLILNTMPYKFSFLIVIIVSSTLFIIGLFLLHITIQFVAERA